MVTIVFTDVAAPPEPARAIKPRRSTANSARMDELERELAQAPYRTLENMIDGVVITFMDITISKKLEADLREMTANR
ncbi:MAG: hypothetical protein HY867_15535 [Chloroflexi bacterium]|nr:hypothetical protein [Chloroflexota bacterium]